MIEEKVKVDTVVNPSALLIHLLERDCRTEFFVELGGLRSLKVSSYKIGDWEVSVSDTQLYKEVESTYFTLIVKDYINE